MKIALFCWEAQSMHESLNRGIFFEDLCSIYRLKVHSILLHEQLYSPAAHGRQYEEFVGDLFLAYDLCGKRHLYF